MKVFHKGAGKGLGTDSIIKLKKNFMKKAVLFTVLVVVVVLLVIGYVWY